MMTTLCSHEERRGGIWINGTLGTVEKHEVARMFRSPIGDWCAEIVIAGWANIAIFDYHPTVATLRAL
jgi:hypothetical protein